MNLEPGNDLDIVDVFRKTRSVAVVGMSADPTKPSHGVGKYLAEYYDIYPVNPDYQEILGYPCYPSIGAIVEPIDVINIFQRSDRIGLFVEETKAKQPTVFWMQLGIYNAQARASLEGAGIMVVENKCTKIEHARLHRTGLL
ncbi:MAG: CoA-binding protein [Gammaproteobacteria bacterium]|jgi:uncharacterized protein|nr:CoA-binding protein [Gammaproteobacteria bacterium]MBT5202385.1 CoA-binding protein [Gammaproteobacteria bacterium]MBT5600989.1 CoA-binding protein [Gammaproteobacteria bacterium]MBT6245278.1 CoA-binding protein [Gammaproteobacteria bacterium]